MDRKKSRKELIEELNSLRSKSSEMERLREELSEIKKEYSSSQEYFRNMVDSIDDPVFVKDRKHRWVFLNKAACKFWGYPKQKLIGKTDYDIFPPQEADIYWEKDNQVFESGCPDLNEEPQTIDGTLHVIATKKSLYADSRTGEKYIVGTIRDITETKKRLEAEEAMRHSEAMYRHVVENAAEGIVVIKEGFIQFTNPKVEQIVGCHKKELLSRPFLEFIHSDDRQMASENYRKRLKGEEVPQMYKLRLIHSAGQIRLVQVSGVVIDWEGGPATLNFLTDITEAEKAEDKLRLKEKELVQSQKMEAVGRLAGGIAHDFNNLVTAIIGYAELLKMKQGLHQEFLHCVNEIIESANRAVSLVQQLLAFSRKQIMKPREIDLNQLVEELDNMLDRIIGEDIILERIMEPHLNHIKADPVQVQQIIMNLAVNARDAMPEGGKIRITTKNVYLDKAYCSGHSDIEPGNYVMLCMEDEGQGMDQEIRKRAFEPFFTTKELGKGTGLGLSTVYGIVKQSGGDITVNSEVGKGSIFTIYFPSINFNNKEN